MTPKLILVVAASRNGVIGRKGTLPWRQKSDLKAFRDLTMGHPVVMGRRTYQSLPGSLKGRQQIVISRHLSEVSKGSSLSASLEEGLAQARQVCSKTGAQAIMVIGGGEIYEATRALADEIYLTLIETDIEGDTFFAMPDKSWKLNSARSIDAGPEDDFPMTICHYVR